jgi:hypothetical protein
LIQHRKSIAGSDKSGSDQSNFSFHRTTLPTSVSA